MLDFYGGTHPLKLFSARKPQSAPPIIVGNFMRSGSTLFRRMLNAHSRIYCGPEIKFFPDFYGNYRKDELAHARYFSTLRSLGISEKKLLTLCGAQFLEVQELAMRNAGKVRWANKSPDNVLYLPQWRQLLKNKFHFVFLVRDPLDTLASLIEAGFHKAVPPSLEAKVALFKEYLTCAQQYLVKHSAQSIVIQYESLVKTPEETLRKFFTRIEENFEPDVLNYRKLLKQKQGIEDPKIYQHDTINTASLGRGQVEFSQESQALIHHALDDLYQRLCERTIEHD